MARKKHMSVDTDDSVVKKLTVGTQATITIKGRVTELEASREIEFGPKEEKDKIPARIAFEVKSVKVEGENAFAQLADDPLDADEE